MNASIMLALLLASPGAETPSQAIELAAAKASSERGVRVAKGLFSRLPNPGPGTQFFATGLDERDPRFFQVEVVARVDGRVVGREVYRLPWRRPVRFVLVAAKHIPKGAIVGFDDIRREPFKGRRSDLYLQSAESAVGSVARYALANGVKIRTSALRPPRLVRRGEKVRVLVRSGGLVVSAVGVALGGGARGDTIKIRNGRSRRVIEAVVTQPGVAEIQEGP